MKSFFLSLSHFILALIVTVGIGIYLRTKQPNPPPTSATVPTSPPVSSPPLTPPGSPISSTPLTPPLQSPSPLAKETKPLPAPSPKPVNTSTNEPNQPSQVATNSPSLPVQTTGTELPTHLFYQENAQNLVEIGTFYDRREYLNQEAAEAFKQMKLAAQQEGIELIPISGFRSVADQEKLFERQIKRQGSRQAAARLSAPPNFSEHHTGYTLDIGDGKRPETVLKVAFESTEAYRWLKAHAAQYGFELSFPPNNPQGVSYEPWHWRFVGSPTAKEIFGPARTLSP